MPTQGNGARPGLTLPNSWFTVGSSVTESGLSQWTPRAVSPGDIRALKLAGESESAQRAELTAVVLAVRHSLGEKQKIMYIFTDSWAVASGISKMGKNSF